MIRGVLGSASDPADAVRRLAGLAEDAGGPDAVAVREVGRPPDGGSRLRLAADNACSQVSGDTWVPRNACRRVRPAALPDVPEQIDVRWRDRYSPCYVRANPGRVRRPVAGAGDRARAVTASQPRHRSPAAPAPFAARWRELAACRGADLDLFFPGRGESAEPARQVCARCPVREPCLDYALSHGIVHGIWGGLAERDRRALRSRHVGAARRQRDEAIAATSAAGYSQAAISRALGLARTSVSRVLSRGADRQGRS